MQGGPGASCAGLEYRKGHQGPDPRARQRRLGHGRGTKLLEFAKQRQDAGLSGFEAAVEASRLRLRPILMTSFAFIFGVIPLVLASGAGAEMRRALGTAVFSGMLGVTLFGIFLTPVFYVVIRWFTEKRTSSSQQPVTSRSSGAEAQA